MKKRPVPWYKYMQREYAESLVRDGVVRIGTLAEFRDTESHGEEIGDADEGRDLPTENVAFASNNIPGSASPFVELFLPMQPGPGQIVVRDSTFQMVNEAPHSFAFCASTVLDPIQMERLGYDACVLIADPKRFISALTTQLMHRRLVKGSPLIGPCVYRERERDWRRPSDTHPGLLKPLRYSYQQEVRAIWVARDPEAAPVKLEVLAAARACRLLQVTRPAA